MEEDEYLSRMKKTDKFTPVIDTCLELGLSEKDILDRLQKKLNISLQTAVGTVNLHVKQGQIYGLLG